MIQFSKRKLIGIGVVVILLFIILSVILGIFAERMLEKKIASLTKEYDAQISYSSLDFKRGGRVIIRGLNIRHDSLALLEMDEMQVKVSLMQLLFGKKDVQAIKAQHILVNIQKKDSLYSYKIRKIKNIPKVTEKKKKDLSAEINSFQELIWQLLPSEMEITDASVRIAMDDSLFTMHFEELKMSGNELAQTEITCANSYRQGIYKAVAMIDPAEKEISARIALVEGEAVHLPYADHRFHVLLTSEVADFSIKSRKAGRNTNRLSGDVSLGKVLFYHKNVSNLPIHLDKLKVQFVINSSGKALEMDSSSLITVNRFSFHPYLRYERGKDRRLAFGLNTGKFKVEKLISSIPEGLFRQLEGFKAKGHLEYRFYTDIRFNQLDSLVFQSRLKKHDFRAVSFGKLNYQRLLDSFTYTAYKKDVPQRTFAVGPANPHYRAYGNINDSLKYAVIYSEDGAFFYHWGFIESAFRDAMIVNLKRKKFARGGSTISMQFVKNVFLHSQKVLSRKVEEIIIVWLMENYRLLSKERIFEIYLNIIEWGPGIYGAGEATHFYFNKEPSQVSLSEAIFMAAIIPRPTGFKYAFDSTGRLKNYFEGHYRLVLGRMVRSGMITQEFADRVPDKVSLTGPALQFIIPEKLTEATGEGEVEIKMIKVK